MAQLTRDQFLKMIAAGTASFLGLQSTVYGQEAPKGPLVPWSRLKFIGEMGDDQDWHVHPHGDLNLIDSIRDQTSVNLDKKWNVADVDNLNSMVQYPFLFMHGEIAPILTPQSRQNLREYLMRGGFLFAEDCVCGYSHHGGNKLNDYFFRAMAGELTALLPGATFEQLSPDHPLFRCFYHFDVWPHMQGYPHGPWGLTYNGRLAALLSPSDLHCGWTNGDTWFGTDKRIAAMQMGTNIYMYAMTQGT
ncbi:MAG TPA: DUF4159 domain-containing protein [Candidatus Methylacidiphilales bacterium]